MIRALNLGCGQRPVPQHLNVDLRPGPGVDFVWDLEQYPWPWETGSIERIRASHVFEHIIGFDPFWSEIHRVLCPGGLVHAWVPYGIHGWANDPYHMHPWTERTLDRLCGGSNTCLLDQGRKFRIAHVRIIGNGFPWWHLADRFDYRPKPPLKRWRYEMEFVMERI